MHIDLYKAFQLDRRASSAELGQRLTERLNRTDPADARARQQIDTARRILSDPQRRATYDGHLADLFAPPITEETLTALATGGSVLHATDQFVPASSAGAVSGQNPASPTPAFPPQSWGPGAVSKRGRGKKLLIGGAVGVVVLLALIIGLALAGSHGDSSSNSGVAVPDVVGQVLPQAVNEIHAAGLKAATLDAAGQQRKIYIESNWMVCSTEPKAGVKVYPGTIIQLNVSKAYSNCPGQ